MTKEGRKAGNGLTTDEQINTDSTEENKGNEAQNGMANE
jgi:hypothetical protein